MKPIFLLALLSSLSVNLFAAPLNQQEQMALKALIDGEHRSDKLRARNQYRHPFETLNFFEVNQDLTVVEIWPGGQGGWYRSILEPYLQSSGKYIPVRSGDDFPAPMDKVPNGTADMVLVFRAHGFMIYEKPVSQYYDALFNMLKPGGVLGIVDHRGDESVPQDPNGGNGYVNQSHVIKLASEAGFKLVAQSEINANPKDTKDYPDGLYSLPPTLRGSFFDSKLRERMLAIGESDRMTLKFIKP